jgi:hypothetical protein
LSFSRKNDAALDVGLPTSTLAIGGLQAPGERLATCPNKKRAQGSASRRGYGRAVALSVSGVIAGPGQGWRHSAVGERARCAAMMTRFTSLAARTMTPRVCA